MSRFSKVFIGVVIVSLILIFASPVVKPTVEWADEELKTVESKDKYTVIVVGSDPEGIAAAVGAARSGAKTLLLGKENGPGGLFTYGMLNSLDMNTNESGELLTRGIFNEFYQKIDRKDSFDVENVKNIFTEMINAEENLTYLPNYKFVEPIMVDKTLVGVKMQNLNQEQESFYGMRIIDATQDGDVIAKAQDVILGGSAEGSLYYVGMSDLNLSDKMAATLVFKVSGVDWKQLKVDIEAYKHETGDPDCGINSVSAWGFGKWCYDKYTPRYSNMKLRGPNMGLQDDGTVLINALQIFDIDGLDEASINKAKKLGEEEVTYALKHLKKIIPAFEDAELVSVADELYIRETRHIQGEYVLTATDLLDNTNFYDKVALGSYPIDIQSTNINNTGYVIGKPTVYSIPLRCLIPLEVENAFIVGKAASYSSVAAGSARVVPVGMVTGESAGIIAVYSAINDISPRQLAKNKEEIKNVTNILKRQGVYLPEFKYKSTIPDTDATSSIRKILNLGYLSAGYTNNYRLDEDATCAGFVMSIINGLQRVGEEKYNDQVVNRIKYYYDTEEKITALKAGEIMARLNGASIGSLREESSKWEMLNKSGYFAEIKDKLKIDQVLTKEQMYILTVDALEKYLGKELK